MHRYLKYKTKYYNLKEKISDKLFYGTSKKQNIVKSGNIVFNLKWMALLSIANFNTCDIESGFICDTPYIMENYDGAFKQLNISGYLCHVNSASFHIKNKHQYVSDNDVDILQTEYIDNIINAIKNENVNIIYYHDKLHALANITKTRMYHDMQLSDPYYKQVLQGRKIYELCINDDKHKKINIGDIIKISNRTNNNDNFQVVVIDKKHYASFHDAIKSVDFKEILPDISDIQSAVNLYYTFPNYEKDEKIHGVVLFQIVVNNNIQNYDLSIQNPDKCPTFDLIASGKKPVEGRKNSKKYQEYKPGDTITFMYKDKRLKTLITKINKYNDVKDYLINETIENALPGCVETIDEAINIYKLWVAPEEIKELKEKYGFGFLGIHIKLL